MYHIVFLDVDGVLNAHHELYLIQAINRDLYKEDGGSYLDATEYHIEVLDEMCKLDNKIRFVISSCWRYVNCESWFKKEFKRLNSKISCENIIGHTPRSSRRIFLDNSDQYTQKRKKFNRIF